MHEAGLAARIVEVASGIARERGPDTWVKTVRIRVGELTGVACEALAFAFESLREGTRCDTARLEFERVPLEARCRACGWQGPLGRDWQLSCSACGSPLDPLAGRELELAAVVLEDESREDRNK